MAPTHPLVEGLARPPSQSSSLLNPCGAGQFLGCTEAPMLRACAHTLLFLPKAVLPPPPGSQWTVVPCSSHSGQNPGVHGPHPLPVDDSYSLPASPWGAASGAARVAV